MISSRLHNRWTRDPVVTLEIDPEGAEWLADEMEALWALGRDGAARDIADALRESLRALNPEGDGDEEP